MTKADDWMKWRVQFGTPEHFVMIEEFVRGKDAEIERLREQVAALQASSGYEASIAQVEIARLRTQCGGNCRYWEGRYRDEAKDNERLRALVKDLADDLEAELNGHYPPEVRAYPSEQRRYERDMANVYEARRALEPKP